MTDPGQMPQFGQLPAYRQNPSLRSAAGAVAIQFDGLMQQRRSDQAQRLA
jgi:hypothetical protein